MNDHYHRTRLTGFTLIELLGNRSQNIVQDGVGISDGAGRPVKWA